MRILIAGWFSFDQMGATAGDLLSKDIICQWLDEIKLPYDVALEKPFEGGVKWKEVSPAKYTHVIFICGPFGNGWPVTDFLDRFSGKKLIGLNLSLIDPLDEWNPFNLLLERDSSQTSNPDFVFLSNKSKVPVVGLTLVEPQKEYRGRSRHKEANLEIQKFLNQRQCAIIPIDTRLDVENKSGFRTPQEVESAISKVDVMVTTRLHGMVLAIKNGIPVLAVDAVDGGAKISRQSQEIGWTNVVTINNLSQNRLSEMFEYCLTDNAKKIALGCYESSLKKLSKVKDRICNWFSSENISLKS